MTRTGWHAREWSEAYFKVLDVAARVGSGVGSYGVRHTLPELPKGGASRGAGDAPQPLRVIGHDIRSFHPPHSQPSALRPLSSPWAGAPVRRQDAQTAQVLRFGEAAQLGEG